MIHYLSSPWFWPEPWDSFLPLTVPYSSTASFQAQSVLLCPFEPHYLADIIAIRKRHPRLPILFLFLKDYPPPLAYSDILTKPDPAELDYRTQNLFNQETENNDFWSMFMRHHAVMLLINPESGHIVKANPAALHFYAYAKEDFEGQHISLINTLSTQEIQNELKRAHTEQCNHFLFPHRLSSGEIREVELHSSPVFINGQSYLYSIIHDITERQEWERRMQAALHERELLLREIHHRVKNNFQVMISLLNLQYRKITNTIARQAIQNTRQRIRSMALVHEYLYESHHLLKVSFADYLQCLIREVVPSLTDRPQYIHFHTVLSPLDLDIEQAIPCGMILNELISNAIQHAFPLEQTDCVIQVRLSVANQCAEISIHDNGIGIRPTQSYALGLHLVQQLSQQLDGSCVLTNDNGTCWLLRFKVKNSGL